MTEGTETQPNKSLVLLVDDDEDILMTMEAALKPMKEIQLDRATNGNQAVDKAEKNDPDVIVLDMMLPKKSGFLVMERIRQKRLRTKSKRPYVIMVTANTGQRHKDYAKTLGVNEYINKPFRMDRLVTAVKTFIVEAEAEKKKGNPG